MVLEILFVYGFGADMFSSNNWVPHMKISKKKANEYNVLTCI